MSGWKSVRFALAVFSVVVLVPRALGQVTVTPNPYGAPTVSPFPPGSPPSDLKPGEDADTLAGVSVSAGENDVELSKNADGTFSITKITASVSGSSTIREPVGAPAALHDHEVGHDTLFKDEYDKNAKRKAEAALKDLLGKKFKTPQDAQAAFDATLKKASDAIRQQMQALSDKYDKLTHHGDGTGAGTNAGVTDAKKERDNAKPAGQNPQVPQNAGPKGQNSNFHSFLDSNDRIQFSTTAFITNPLNANDPINHHGVLAIEPFIRIGPQDNGTTLLTDGYFRIFDFLTGDLFLDGFLFEAALMPSSVPGYSEMIEAYLDIPPAAAGGITNSINSPLLAQMDAAAAAGVPFEFWYFFNGSLTDPNGSTGDVIIGVPVPEPASVLVLGMVALLPYRRARRMRRRPSALSAVASQGIKAWSAPERAFAKSSTSCVSSW